jgi:hypothetical protein
MSWGFQSQADEGVAKLVTFVRAALSPPRLWTLSGNPLCLLQQCVLNILYRIDLPIIGNI